MSYDLYLDRAAPVTADEFHEYFSARPHFKADGVEAHYANEDTGVYFLFYLAEQPAEDGPSHKVSFNLNYFRPHFFAREAAPELSAFISASGFSIHDPQNHGMGDGPFSEEGFLRGWDHGNAFGYRAVLQSEGAPRSVHARPTAELDAIWRWNHQRESVQAKLGESVFVPRVFWVVANGTLMSAAVWPDGISELVPAVDVYFIGRDELAPRRFFRRVKDTCVVARAELEASLGEFDAGKYSLPARLFDTGSIRSEIRRFVSSLPKSNIETTAISVDQVLNEELVRQAR